MQNRIFLLTLVFMILCSPTQVFAEKYIPPSISFHHKNGSIDYSTSLPIGNTLGGMSLRAADLGSDGISEFLVGNGLGQKPLVHILRQDGSVIHSFLAYEKGMDAGISLEACDLTGDGVPEIITAPERGGGPHVRVFSNTGVAYGDGTFVYNPFSHDGVRLACGDVLGDARSELVTFPKAGSGPHVRVWSWQNNTLTLEHEQFVGSQDDARGLVGTVVDGMILMTQQRNPTQLITLDPTSEKISATDFSREVHDVTSLFIHSKKIHIATTGGAIYLPHEDTLLQTGHHTSIIADVVSETDTIVTIPYGAPTIATTDEKLIDVNLTDQQLRAYENGVLTKTFYISSARQPWQTPTGKHRISAKKPLVHYAWFYGSGSSENYDLGWIPYNLQFYPHIYLHYAPWHDNFGHPMSHGCVNVNLSDMQWLYHWSKEGVLVDVHE